MSKDNHSKLALVTGGTKGIGRAVVWELLKEGYSTIINYSDDHAAAEKLKDELLSSGINDYCFHRGDIALRSTIVDIIKLARSKYSVPIQYLVNNAGILNQTDFFSLTEAEWDRTFDVNLKGPFQACQNLMPLMQDQYAAIVNVVSIGGQTGGHKAPDYAASKGALMTFTQSMARLGAPNGIRVNAVSPGWINTGIFSDEQTQNLEQEALRSIPLARMGTPEEIATVIAFLLSEKASYITGQIINVNGGMYF